MKLTEQFYLREDVTQIARDLLGTYLVTNLEGGITRGMIVETEAYEGATDRASHAYNNRRTARTEIMFRKGGTAYIYLCYGVHSLFNIVTNQTDIPHAVLIRGIIPVSGIEIMLGRTGKDRLTPESGIGPGKVSGLLGIHYSITGTSLLGDKIWLEERKIRVSDSDIIAGPRIGVQYAGPDALLPYRYRLSKELFPR
jgi:DNA-3-methyladenine glycosylase